MLNRSVRFAAVVALGFAAPSAALAAGEPQPRVTKQDDWTDAHAAEYTVEYAGT